jgi:hypothetical protein
MNLSKLNEWLSDPSKERSLWLVKRLSANDTLATRAHQAGPYIPKPVLFELFPSLNQPDAVNPEATLHSQIDSHGSRKRAVRAVWYNSKVRRAGTRNEARITRWGGSASPMLNPESTGSIAVLVFDRSGPELLVRVWVCGDVAEEELIESQFGVLEPGQIRVWTAVREQEALISSDALDSSPCWMESTELPPSWLSRFPTGAELVAKSIEKRAGRGVDVDTRLIRRRDCEYQIFLSLERAIESPYIQRGFESVDSFVSHAQSILQRRKSRSGRSLELQVLAILEEEALGQYAHQGESEDGKKPDFLFPSVAAYQDSRFPPERLRMLAVKTTCKDRWRQVINEADRISTKHLLTLQEGVSETQFAEMRAAGIRLVVPKKLFSKYPKSVRPELITLAQFISELKALQ